MILDEVALRPLIHLAFKIFISKKKMQSALEKCGKTLIFHASDQLSPSESSLALTEFLLTYPPDIPHFGLEHLAVQHTPSVFSPVGPRCP